MRPRDSMNRRKLLPLFAIPVGAAIMAFGLNYFNLANNLAEGGVTGVAILLKLSLNVDPGLTTLLVNLPLLVLGWKTLGRSALFGTIYGTASLSLFLWLFGRMRYPMQDLLLASLFAGVSVGLGLGLIFRYGGTTGGVDIIARVLEKYLGWKVGRTMLFADIAVLAVSLAYLTPQQVMYTLVAVFVGTRIIDFVQDAAYAARAAFVVSNHGPEIARRVMAELQRGTTILRGEGAYTGEQKAVLYIVVSRSEVMRLKSLILSVDPAAFITISEASEVMGEGFTLDAQRRPVSS